ncbi:MAG TPA: hypothetical protein VKV40_14525 [Ktedonobacteraceae bacterium]|nr:hypothetical protein [Ktedonobacteraceae bacterium]
MTNAEVATHPITVHVLQTRAYEILETSRDLFAKAAQITSTYDGKIALVTMRFEFERKVAVEHTAQVEHSTVSFLQTLRPLVRKTDAVFLLDDTLYFFLFDANAQGGQIVQDRLWDTVLWSLHNSQGETLQPCSITAGYGAYPVPHSSMDACIEAAKKEQLRFEVPGEKAARKMARGRAAQGQPREEATEEELSLLARKLGIPYLSLLPSETPKRVQQLVNPRLAHELRCYPLGRERNMLTVAMINPQDGTALARLRQETGLAIFPVLTNPSALQIALEKLG